MTNKFSFHGNSMFMTHDVYWEEGIQTNIVEIRKNVTRQPSES